MYPIKVETDSIYSEYHICGDEKFEYAHELKKPTGTLDEILIWNKNELTDNWKWQLVDVSSRQWPGRYIFYFNSERDYIVFLLKWS